MQSQPDDDELPRSFDEIQSPSSPLHTKTAAEVVHEVVEMFCIFGNPHILQFDNGREFSNKI